MALPCLFQSKHYIAVVGLYRSGKSAFITSFINHLKHHRPCDLKLGDGSIRLIFDEDLPPLNGFSQFPYEAFRGDNDGRWPTKTKAFYQYRGTFFRSDWTFTQGEIALLDIPGERLADVPIAHLDFPQWSDWLLNRVFEDKSYRQSTVEYRDCLTKENVTEDEIVAAYRRLMADLYKTFRPAITPSTFVLGEDGTFHGPSIIKGDISAAFTGLSEDSQFAPLPSALQLKDNDLRSRFAERYLGYQTEVAKPLVRNLSQCNELAVLVDPTTLLGANTGMYTANLALMDQLFRVLSPGQDFFGMGLDVFRRIVGFGYWRQTGISRVAVIATKADKVHDSQRDKLLLLARRMVEPMLDRLVRKKLNLDFKFFGCSAVKSTFSQPNGQLHGQLAAGHNFSEYSSSELPEDWPGSWAEGDFVFPDVDPSFPENTAVPPDHLGMDDVMDFLLK